MKKVSTAMASQPPSVTMARLRRFTTSNASSTATAVAAMAKPMAQWRARKRIWSGRRRIAEIVVVGGGKGPCTPCGGCRQRLAEFARRDTPVHMADPKGRVVLSTTLGALLPHAFGPMNLEKK